MNTIIQLFLIFIIIFCMEDWAFDTHEEFSEDDFCIYTCDVNDDLDDLMDKKKANYKTRQDLEKTY